MSTKAPYTLRLSADAAAPPEPSWAVERERNVAASAWAAARRRKWLILSVTLLVFTGGFVGLLALPPAYRASGTVLLEAPKTVVFQRPGVTASTPPATEMLADELEVLRSRELLRRVVAGLGLEADPDFNPLLRPPACWRRPTVSSGCWAAGPRNRCTGSWRSSACSARRRAASTRPCRAWTATSPSAPSGAAAPSRSRRRHGCRSGRPRSPMAWRRPIWKCGPSCGRRSCGPSAPG
ncbi:Wzz/FepE/Etk N-terminal domain-containing protein [Teichococcus aestuarii]|uniref:Wzz/FepE/Etk N-terminal domain-containing protein n=1 Tax=Teichococcus aestuarii TaxID=568898 RepID=UPI003613F514